MPTEIPESLAALQMENITAETPRLARKRIPASRQVNIEEIVTKAIDRREKDYKPEQLWEAQTLLYGGEAHVEAQLYSANIASETE
jgi:hypothetical protein